MDFTTTRHSYSVAMMLRCRARHCNANTAAALQWRWNARTPVYLYLGGQNYPGGQNNPESSTMVHLIIRLGFLHVNHFCALDKLGLSMRLWLSMDEPWTMKDELSSSWPSSHGRAQLVNGTYSFLAMPWPSLVLSRCSVILLVDGSTQCMGQRKQK